MVRVRAGLIIAVLQFVAGAGGNADRVRSAAGFRTGDLLDPERMVDMERLAATLSHAAAELDDPTFGLQLGANFDLCDGHPSLPRMGPTVGLGARTLQRRLAVRDLVFRTVVEQVRRRVASQYLAQSDSCLTEIAFLLGYSQLSAFSASCAGIEEDLLRKLEDDLAALVVHDVVDVDQGLA